MDLADDRSAQGTRHNGVAIAILERGSPLDEISQVDGQIQQAEPMRATADGNWLGGCIQIAGFENGLSDRPHLGDGIIHFGATHLQVGG